MNDDSRFLIKLLGFSMQSVNFKPENFIKLFWHMVWMVLVLKFGWILLDALGNALVSLF